MESTEYSWGDQHLICGGFLFDPKAKRVTIQDVFAYIASFSLPIPVRATIYNDQGVLIGYSGEVSVISEWQWVRFPMSLNFDTTLFGDVNEDGWVDLRDLAFCARSYGCAAPLPCYNPICDVNNDSKIDIKDLAMLAKNYGRTKHFWLGIISNKNIRHRIGAASGNVRYAKIPVNYPQIPTNINSPTYYSPVFSIYAEYF